MTTESSGSGLRKSDRSAGPGPAEQTADPVRPQPGGAGGSQQTGYGVVFAVREFRPIFAAHVLSLLGTVVAEVSLAVLIFRLTGSPLLTALTFALGFLPYALSGTLLSGIADRYPARRVLVSCDLLCAVCVAVMALPVTPLAMLFVMRFAVAMVSPIFTGTRAASLADILEGDAYVLGRSLIRIVSQGAQIVGYGLGGLLLIVVSPRSALTVTALTFLSSALLLRVGTVRRPARVSGSGTMMRQSIAGAGLLLRDRRIRALLLLWWIPTMFFVMPEALAAPFTAGIGVGTVGLGLFLAAMPAGTVAGEILAGSVLSPETRSRITAPLVVVSLVPLVTFALRPTLPWAIAAMFAVGLCHAYTLGIDKWFMDAVPEDLRGRAMTLMGAGMMTVQGVGMMASGLVAEFVAPHDVTALAGVVGTGSAVLVLRGVQKSRSGAPAAD